MKAATIYLLSPEMDGKTISIHAAREGGDGSSKIILLFVFISIHAAREGGDYRDVITEEADPISIHAAREGGDGGNE